MRQGGGFPVYLTPSRVSSPLSGSHGEWTASDDVAQGLVTVVEYIVRFYVGAAVRRYQGTEFDDSGPDVSVSDEHNATLLAFLGLAAIPDSITHFAVVLHGVPRIVHLCPVTAWDNGELIVLLEYPPQVILTYLVTHYYLTSHLADGADPQVASQLNGNNGEYTDVDDHGKGARGSLDSALEQFGSGRARPFISNASKFQKPVNGGRANPDNAARRLAGKPRLPVPPTPSSSLVDWPALGEEVVDPLPGPPPVLKTHFVVDSGCGYLWTGSSFAQRIDGLGAVDADGTIYSVAPVDSIHSSVIQSGPGFFTTTTEVGKGEIKSARPCAYNRTFGDDVVRGVPGFVSLVFIPLMNALAQKLPGALKSHTFEAAMAIARTTVGTSVPVLVNSTVRAYVHSLNLSSNQKLSQVVASAPQELSALDVMERKVVTTGGTCMFYDGPVRICAETCVLPIDWIPRDRYKVTCYGGATCDLTADPPEYPKFNTEGADGTVWYDTEYFRFVGTGCVPFVTYACNPDNTVQAFKRFLAARDSVATDDIYYANQAYLLNTLSSAYQTSMGAGRYAHSTAMLKNIATSFSWDPNGLGRLMRVGRGQHSHEIHLSKAGVVDPAFAIQSGSAFVQGCAEAILPSMMDFIDKCSPTYLERAVGAMGNARDWAYFNIQMAKMTLFEPFLSREGCAEIAHVKKKLRQWYVTKQEIHSDDRVMVKLLNAKVKRELGKFGKVPRFFVTYEAGSMYANELPEFIKMCIDGLTYAAYGDVTLITYVIAKPKSDSFSKTFQMAIEATSVPNTVFVAIYSDDTLYSGCIGGTNFMFNVDISSCDCNQNSLMFYMVSAMLSEQHGPRALGLIEQCMKKVRVTNPFNKNEFFDIQMHGPLEGSGTVLTTILNHTASFLGANAAAHCLSELLKFKLSGGHPVVLEDIRLSITTGAALVGHKVTTSFCGDLAGNVTVEKAQFMKKSPMYTDSGLLVPTTNIGCVLRSLGLVQGDLLPEKLCLTPEVYHTMTWQQRSDRFTAGILYGLKHEPGNPVLDALRSRFLTGTVPDSDLERVFSVNNQGNPDVVAWDAVLEPVSVASFQARYDVTDEELATLIAQIADIQVGAVKSSRACAKMYMVDYEVGPVLGL